jgi:hypothetical protein
MNHDTVFAGLDVHKDSITAACIGIHPSEPPVDLGTVGTQQYAVDPARETFRPRDLAVCLRGWPVRLLAGALSSIQGRVLLVAAPPLIPKRRGERIETDRRDARNLALALRAATLSACMYRPPMKKRSATSCAPRSRAKRDITCAKQRLKAFLLRNDIRHSGLATCVTPACHLPLSAN